MDYISRHTYHDSSSSNPRCHIPTHHGWVNRLCISIMENIDVMPLVAWPTLSEDVRSAIVLELKDYIDQLRYLEAHISVMWNLLTARAGMTIALRTGPTRQHHVLFLNFIDTTGFISPLILPYIPFSCHIPEIHLYARRLRNAQHPHTRWER